MPTQIPADCLQASLAGAQLLVCPPKLVRGNEGVLMNIALPLVESYGVILDMSLVESMDAAGVGLLMTLRQVADRSATSLVLANPSRRALEILTILGLDGVLLCKAA